MVTIHPVAQCHSLEDPNPELHHCGNLRFQVILQPLSSEEMTEAMECSHISGIYIHMQCRKPEGHKLNYNFTEPSTYLKKKCSCSIQTLSLILKGTALTPD